MKYKFTEVLNDLVNYFLLGDIQLLEEWKKGNNLSDNLAMEFTTTESAEAAIPLRLPTKNLCCLHGGSWNNLLPTTWMI